MSEPVVTFSKSDSIGYITMDRPPANSYEIEFIHELGVAIDGANDDAEVKAVILQSASEKFFSAGADIKAFSVNSSDVNMDMVRASHKVLDKMAASLKVFIAAIQGHALGGGLEIALACDLRFAAEGDYRLGLPEVTLGMLPDNGGTQRLPRLIGAGKALELMISGDTVDPQQALELGMLNRLYPRDSFGQETAAYAEKLAEGATLAIGRIKQAVHQGSDMKMKDALAWERNLAQPLFDSDDAKEGFAAFVEKRTPSFKGR
jgi:enoyl-CoA hydratase/carnithine racemase